MQLHVGRKPEKNMQSWYEGIGLLFLFRSVWKPELLKNVWRKSVMHHFWYNRVKNLFLNVLLDLWFHKEETNYSSYSREFDTKQCSIIRDHFSVHAHSYALELCTFWWGGHGTGVCAYWLGCLKPAEFPKQSTTITGYTSKSRCFYYNKWSIYSTELESLVK